MRGMNMLAALLVFALLLLAACGGTSPNAKFYSLSSVTAPESTGTAIAKESSVIAIGPLRIPEYLDRPQIITRSGPNELYYSEFQRWGGSLENELRRVLSQDIGMLLGTGYSVINWPSSGEGTVPILYRVIVDILQFEGVSGNQVVLKSQWAIIGNKEQERLVARTSTVAEQIAGPGYEEVVAAMSRAVAKLSREIAGSVSTLPRPEVK